MLSPSLTLLGHQRPTSAALKLYFSKFQNVTPDDFFQKLPKFGKMKFGNSKVPTLVSSNVVKGYITSFKDNNGYWIKGWNILKTICSPFKLTSIKPI